MSGPPALGDLGRTLVLDELFDLSLYRTLHAQTTGDLQRMLGDLIPIETKHLQFWQRFFGLDLDRLDGARRLKLGVITLACRLVGDPAIHLVLEAIEIYGVRKYLTVWEAYRNEPLGEAVKDILADELGHEDRIVSELIERRIDPERVRNFFLGFNDGDLLGLGYHERARSYGGGFEPRRRRRSAMRNSHNGLSGWLVVGVLLVAATAHGQGITDMKKGEGGSAVQGSAGPSGSQDAASDLERCPKPMGALAVVEPQDYVGRALARYNLQSPTGIIRLMVQQSNCFIVVERGIGMKNLMQERSLAQSGQLREGSNMGGGQMVTADFILTPAIVFSESNAGGIGGGLGAVGGLFGRGGRALGAVAGGLKFKEAQTSMLLADGRTGVQVAAAEGSASKADFRLGGLFAGAGGGVGGAAAIGGYSNTAEGKVLAASLADNYNGIVKAVRANPSLQRDVGSLAEEAGARPKAGAVFNEGDVLRPKIANVKVLSQPSDNGATITTLAKTDELIFMGKEQDGYLSVETGKGTGWVKKVLVTR